MNKKISFYTILSITNIIVFVLMIWVYYSCGDNQYINQTTIYLNAVMIAISHFMIKDGSKQNNPLIAVLAFVTILHFEFRIVTLNYVEFSSVMERALITPLKMNYALLFDLFAYLVLWMGIRCRRKIKIVDDNITLNRRITKKILLLLYVSLALSVAASLGVPVLRQIIGILSIFFFNVGHMALFALGYFMFNWKDESKVNKLLFVSFILLDISIYTLLGSRGQVYSFLIVMFLISLVFNKITVKIKYVVLLLCIVPLMVIGFAYSTLTRAYGVKSLDVDDTTEMMEKMGKYMEGKEAKVILTPVFERIGFLDYSVELIENRDYLSEYINPVNYFKSIVDNLLTPGFNIWNMPKMSNVISKCYEIKGTPDTIKYQLDDGEYQSDGMTLYGEAFLIFGVLFSLPFIYMVGSIFKKIYVNQSKRPSIYSVWIRSCVLFLFYTLIYSYGLDWFIIYLVSFVINYFIFKSIVRYSVIAI